jgi:hypothetical protein
MRSRVKASSSSLLYLLQLCVCCGKVGELDQRVRTTTNSAIDS